MFYFLSEMPEDYSVVIDNRGLKQKFNIGPKVTGL